MSGRCVHRETRWRFRHNHQGTRIWIHLLAINSCDGLIARFTVMLPSVQELLGDCDFFGSNFPLLFAKSICQTAKLISE